METEITCDSVAVKTASDETKKDEELPTELLVDKDAIPEERNALALDKLKKRRSSLRRSINGGFSSTLSGTVFIKLNIQNDNISEI